MFLEESLTEINHSFDIICNSNLLARKYVQMAKTDQNCGMDALLARSN